MPSATPALHLREPRPTDAQDIGAALLDPRVAAHYGLVTETGDAQAVGHAQLKWMRELQASGDAIS